eukprot:g27722.t1
MFRKTESCSLFAIAAFHMLVFLAIPCLFSDKASQTRSCDSVASAFLSATRNTEVFDGDQFFSQCLVSSLTKASQTRSRSSQGRASKEPHEFLKYSNLSSGMTTFDGTTLVGFE